MGNELIERWSLVLSKGGERKGQWREEREERIELTSGLERTISSDLL